MAKGRQGVVIGRRKNRLGGEFKGKAMRRVETWEIWQGRSWKRGRKG